MNEIKKTEFKIKRRTGCVLFIVFFVTLFSISADQQAAIDQLKVEASMNGQKVKSQWTVIE